MQALAARSDYGRVKKEGADGQVRTESLQSRGEKKKRSQQKVNVA
jgi:hypothetical protein